MTGSKGIREGICTVKGTISISEIFVFQSGNAELKVESGGVFTGAQLLSMSSGSSISQNDGTISNSIIRIQSTYSPVLAAGTYSPTNRLEFRNAGGTNVTHTPGAGNIW